MRAVTGSAHVPSAAAQLNGSVKAAADAERMAPSQIAADMGHEAQSYMPRGTQWQCSAKMPGTIHRPQPRQSLPPSLALCFPCCERVRLVPRGGHVTQRGGERWYLCATLRTSSASRPACSSRSLWMLGRSVGSQRVKTARSQRSRSCVWAAQLSARAGAAPGDGGLRASRQLRQGSQAQRRLLRCQDDRASLAIHELVLRYSGGLEALS
eukprot:CAMPEP_0204522982 /NCGR_PEP_ID=MMETSP0661-20131031/6610_1 /ASSEMBLY_ACC=CAM_ASM_000606 /TAXON_ID=109239 /ORGANISM="Alexandrium margalefi, Strain AMGDE01CS-322" /LENGTH=209 /DNA_ID=CAMNT_0051528675 /DNA_START=206 /DNA_END=832 /DNA_ORIENTATION=-